MGDRARQIALALDAMGTAGIRVVRVSSLYETEPVDAPVQPCFLNAVAHAETSLLPRRLLRTLADIERMLGRHRGVLRGPRTIDLDILLYGSSVIRTRELQIPHPRMTERRFVLVPLAQLAPALRHPASRKTAAELLAETPDRSEVRLWRPAAS
jgi:2-amino-4-hydroxy-6-hydroxymethyldihydropteridine diphosphokinase